MKEYIELRVLEKYAPLLLKDSEGERLSDIVRKLTIESNNPLFKQICELDNRLKKEGECFYLGWNFIRKYSNNELEEAKLFHLNIIAVFEPSGEECGTIYDETTACTICQAGRSQVSDLVLDLRKIPKMKDFARTLANEWIVSQRLAEMLVENKLTGFELRPVRHKALYQNDALDLSRVPSGKKLIQKAIYNGIMPDSWEFLVWLNKPEQLDLNLKATEENVSLLEHQIEKNNVSLPTWYQLIVTSQPIPTVPPTKFGIKPFDEDPEGEYRCPLGHVSGLNLLSELSVTKKIWDGSDICKTKDMVGARRGVLVPSPLLLISPRFWRSLKKEKIKGYEVEIAYLI